VRSLWAQEWGKFHRSQETAWEKGGLPEGENKAPEEGGKSTKKRYVFFCITERKKKSLGVVKACYRDAGFDNLSVLINQLLCSFKTQPAACLGSGSTTA